jgi:hypothetical protein
LFVAALHILGPFFPRPYEALICLHRRTAVPIGLILGDLTKLMQHGKSRVKERADGCIGGARHMSLALSMRESHDSVDVVTAGRCTRGDGAGKWLGGEIFLHNGHHQH